MLPVGTGGGRWGIHMEIRRSVGMPSGMSMRLRRVVPAIALIGMMLATAGLRCAAQAADPVRHAVRPMAHHATVYNGELVGSAFALAPGIAVTNGHVVEGLAPGSEVILVASASDTRATARVLAISPVMDLAVLSVPPGLIAPVAAGNSRAGAGLAVSAAGVDASGQTLPRRELKGEVLESHIDVAAFGPGLVLRLPGVRPGFSGGPVLDSQGALVGMIAAICPGRPAAATISGFSPARARPASEEAFVLRAPEMRAEVQRLIED